jgi:hypothetical protein
MHADEKYRRLTPSQPCGQALWWHLLAGQQTGIIPGLFSIGESAFAEQLRWPLEGFREAFREVFREGLAKADWEARLVWVPNALKYNKPASPNVVLSWKEAWLELPECKLKDEAYQRLKAFAEAMSKGFREAFAEAMSKGFAEPGTGTGTGYSPLYPPKGVTKKNRRRRRHETPEEMEARFAAQQEALKIERANLTNQG